MYNDDANEKTYARVEQITSHILRSGYSVIVDATFLNGKDRVRFYELARQEAVKFSVLDCHADEATPRQRVADRMAHDDDASDADLRVLVDQLRHHEPLTPTERDCVVDIPDVTEIAERL